MVCIIHVLNWGSQYRHLVKRNWSLKSDLTFSKSVSFNQITTDYQKRPYFGTQVAR